MKQKNYKVSIGISALNEQHSIERVLKDTLTQKESGWKLKEIIVYCDGCEDKTADIVRGIKNPKIRIYECKDRRGKVYRINQALSDFRGEVLVIFDADIKLEGRNVITNLINEFRKGDKVVLVGGNSRVYPPKTFFERAIYSSYIPYFEAREKLKAGNNVFGCTGACFALRHNFAKRIKIPSWVINEDTFFYFTCISSGYEFRHAKGAKVYYALANNLRVFLKQIFRTHPEAVKIKYKKLFGNLIEEEYQRPLIFYIKSIWKALMLNPIGTLYMIAIKLFCLPFYSLISGSYSLKWYGRGLSQKNSDMKIIISNYDSVKNPYYGGGGATAIHEIASRLTKKFEVTVLTGKYPKSRNEKIDGVLYERIGSTHLGPKIGQIIYQLLLPYFAIRKNYDLWLESFTPPISCAFLPLFTKKPVIALVHNFSEGYMNKKYHLPFYLVERLGIKFYKNFIVLSKFAKDHVLKINNKADVSIIPNGVEVKSINKNRKRTFVLYLGRIDFYQKGLDLLLEAYKYIAQNTTAELKIAGSGTKNDEIKLTNFINNFKLEGKVQVLGKVGGVRKNKLFQSARCIVVPSRYESFPLVVLEALSYGTPIITFDIEGLKWLPQRCALKVKSNNRKSLSEAILKMTKDSKLRDKMTKNGSEFVGNFSWDKSYENYLTFISQKLKIIGGSLI